MDRSQAASRVIVALDFPAADLALLFVDRMAGRLRWVKVGLELYLASGPAIVKQLRERGLQVFLDLKLHDIPTTVAKAVAAVAGLGADLLTVHALGGPEMLRAAQASTRATGGPRLLAVTLLTSLDAAQVEAIGLVQSPADEVLALARLAREASVAGLVCSAAEVAVLRERLGGDVLLVVPGIRPEGSAKGDQARTATPAEAITLGASMLVIGRPLTQAEDPLNAWEALMDELADAPDA